MIQITYDRNSLELIECECIKNEKVDLADLAFTLIDGFNEFLKEAEV
ncbi:hypothetical protein HMPREF1143_0456 [Peptoanaerobacter stomatis]|uniref:Uncharacterized protein n=1 Tax=Peptoanaerobacter stomatis TaxID=796937 RepID=J6HA43_9FIRM|nr:hypothetical protein [Peptoanaerobacter stomatis]EJU22035.1 hypothetical protein HMPREF1143_0456 [Peptoanaerobacter stomatis]